MILDSGEAVFYHTETASEPGNLPGYKPTEFHRAWYGERTVGFSRFFTAKQSNVRVDRLIRIVRPPNDVVFEAEDVCVLSEDSSTYRVVQCQYLRDEDAGEDVADISLERIGRKHECT
ncbi:MAG: hypothetical protein J6N32_01190 [Clostridia bacterium]|nr:hypothetical protein [Clostridia bacterium]